jgi:hypothetical protein
MQHIFGGNREMSPGTITASPKSTTSSAGNRARNSATVPVATIRSPRIVNACGSCAVIVTIRRAHTIMRPALPALAENPWATLHKEAPAFRVSGNKRTVVRMIPGIRNCSIARSRLRSNNRARRVRVRCDRGNRVQHATAVALIAGPAT